jgi:hypothetical protein
MVSLIDRFHDKFRNGLVGVAVTKELDIDRVCLGREFPEGEGGDH